MKALQSLAKAWGHQPSGPIEPAPLAVAPVLVATAQVEVPTQPLDLDAAAERLAPFIERTRAELGGGYVRPLSWPVRGGLVLDPGAHWETHCARLAELADVLRPMAEAWAAGDRPLGEGWPAAPDLYRWEYSRLVAWFKVDPCEVPAQVEAWAGGVTTWRNPIVAAAAAPPKRPAAGPGRCLCCKGWEWWKGSAPGAPWVCATCHPAACPGMVSERRGEPAPAPVTWGEGADVIAQLEQLRPADLPLSFTLRPGVTVTDGAGFLASLKAQAAQGPGGLRAQRGLLLDDVADLLRAIAACARAADTQATPATPAAGLPARREGMTPAEHLAELGGWAVVRERFEIGTAHALWDAARLWGRDQGTDAAERWAARYWAAWEAIAAGRERTS